MHALVISNFRDSNKTHSMKQCPNVLVVSATRQARKQVAPAVALMAAPPSGTHAAVLHLLTTHPAWQGKSWLVPAGCCLPVKCNGWCLSLARLTSPLKVRPSWRTEPTTCLQPHCLSQQRPAVQVCSLPRAQPDGTL